ncbi:MAG: ABC transporter permease [Dehalococcoidia bacterium]|nr:ABC transporter permease [Dehalococcoidia bacterium]
MASSARSIDIPGSRGGSGPTLAARALKFVVTLARRKTMGFICLLVLLFMLVVAAFPGTFATYDPGADAGGRYKKYCLGPSGTFLCPDKVEPGITIAGRVITEASVLKGDHSTPLGTDQLGRDTYSRIVWGARVAVQVGFGAVLLSSLISLTIGVSSGYFGGRYDMVLQRFVDAMMSFPPLVVLLALPNMIGGPSVPKLIGILGVLGGVGGSRVIRSSVIGLRSLQYVDAAKTIGATDVRIMVRHLLPNIFGPLMVQATIGLGATILAEAGLSFLGLGVQSNSHPTWGYMLNLGRAVAVEEPWQAIWPGLAIAIVVFSINMLGDALRDLLDPRLRGARGNFG